MDAFYQGKWQAGDDVTMVVNPLNGEGFDTIPLVGADVLDESLSVLRCGSHKLAAMDRTARNEMFQRIRDIMHSRRVELAETISREQGKILSEAKDEVAVSINVAEVLADNSSLIGPRILPLADETAQFNRQGYTIRHPHGVVAVVSPNPQPLILPVVNTLFALAAGNAVALKPSQHTSVIALRFVEILLDAGVPTDAVACFTGAGKKIGRALCSHRGVDHIICSGSLPTIRDVRSRMSFVTSQFQWGCVASCIVGKSADIETVVSEVMRTAFENSGQSAFTPTWIACFEKNYDALRQCLADRLSNVVTGDPFDEGSQMGPLTELKKVKRVKGRIAYETALGAEVVTGGWEGERLFRPMLLAECDLQKTRFNRKEIPAPVIGLTKISQARQATSVIAKQRHHLLTLFSRDEDWAAREAMRMPFNNVHVNGIPTWRDGLICLPGHPVRTGRRASNDRMGDMSHIRDVVFHSPR